MRIEFPAPEHTYGDAAAIAQYGGLTALDRLVPLDELQGLPCEYWFFIRAARKRE